ncbi:hypothetical protein MD484_g1628, partial [Candolleomyces efflorescens]
MATSTATTLLGEGAEEILLRWKAQGPTDAEVIAYCDAAIAELDSNPTEFQKNVQEVGVWANEIDASFDRITRNLSDIVTKYGKDFPKLSEFSDEWTGYNKRWVADLLLSRNVASEQAGVLNRFDKVFLEIVQEIKTEQDRLDAITELQSFIDEDHTSSQQMSQAFLTLKRDIDHFVVRLDAYLADKKVELLDLVKTLRADIDNLQAQISDLDKKLKQIEDASIALVACGLLLGIIGLAVSGTVLGAFQAERNGKAQQLQQKEKQLEDANRKQQALAQVQTDIDGLKPDITLISEKLVLFGEIWSSVQSQAMQFQASLKGGLAATTNKASLSPVLG